MQNIFIKKRKMLSEWSGGYITLIAVLVSGAVALAVTVSLILLGLSFSRSSFARVEKSQSRVLADACAEEALEVIRGNINYTGTNNLALGAGSCTYTVTNTGGNTRSIASSATVGTIISKVRVTIDALNPKINIASWQEIADF